MMMLTLPPALRRAFASGSRCGPVPITASPSAPAASTMAKAAAAGSLPSSGAAPDDEGERKGATTLFLYGALLVACAAVAGQTEFDEALERVAADAVLKLAHGGGVALVCHAPPGHTAVYARPTRAITLEGAHLRAVARALAERGGRFGAAVAAAALATECGDQEARVVET